MKRIKKSIIFLILLLSFNLLHCICAVRVKNVVDLMEINRQCKNKETGLYYHYFRDYDPELGRYIEPDPLIRGNKNPYVYALANPVSYWDWRGLTEKYWGLGCFGAYGCFLAEVSYCLLQN